MSRTPPRHLDATTCHNSGILSRTALTFVADAARDAISLSLQTLRRQSPRSLLELPIVTFRDASRRHISTFPASLHWKAAGMGIDPFSIEALDLFDKQQGQDAKDRKVYVWHMHTYSRSNDLPALSSFNKAVASRFGGEARVRVNTVAEKPFGPHPCIQFETDFTHSMWGDVVSWAIYNRPTALSILIHPVDEEQVAAHSFRATWVGEPIRLNERPLQAFDKTAALRIADGVARNKAIFDIVTPATMSAETMAEINRIARGETASFPSNKANSDS